MRTFDCVVSVAAPAERVVDEFWNLENWPIVAPHVLAIDLAYVDATVQVLWMTVDTRGRVDRFKSVRLREGDCIHYMQPEPPNILRHHHGSWAFRASNTETVVTSSHTIDVHVELAREALTPIGFETHSDDAVVLAVESLIRNNSLQTMTALKRRIEERNSHVRWNATA